MDRLVTVREMRSRYGVSTPTARRYLRECNPHMEKPLVAPEWAVLEWEDSRTVSTETRAKQTMSRVYVPRHR